jgi:hypothetical protein
VLNAGLNVHHREVAAWVTDSTRADNFIAFLGDLVAATPTGLDLHCIVDNLSAPRHRRRRRVPRRPGPPPRVLALHPHPRLLAQPGRAVLLDPAKTAAALRHGEFDSVDDLADKVIAFINDYNKRATPFRWTYDGRPLQAA